MQTEFRLRVVSDVDGSAGWAEVGLKFGVVGQMMEWGMHWLNSVWECGGCGCG